MTESPIRLHELRRLGQLQIDLGEIINEIGLINDSVATFEQAWGKPGASRPRRFPTRRSIGFCWLARGLSRLANRYDKASRPDDARKSFELAISDFENLAKAIPNDLKYQSPLAEVLQLRADFLWDHGDLDGSRRDYLASVAIKGALV